MIVDVEIPNQGLTITEAKLLRLLKEPGERVEKGEALFEIETDKAVTQVESPESGCVLLWLAREGDVVPLGRVVARIGTEPTDSTRILEAGAPASAAGVSQAKENQETGSPLASPPARSPWLEEKPKASPRARRAARSLGIDLASVKPTGAKGRHVRERDVLTAAKDLADRSPPASGARTAQSRIRELTAARTSASFRDAPHFYLTREVSAEGLVAEREKLKASPRGAIATITDLLVKALALSLRAFPSLNSQWKEGAVLELSRVNVGIAVDTPRGLLVPVLKDADELPLEELAQARRELVESARAGQSRPEDLEGGSFTLTNLGALGVDQFQAVINPPQSGILAAGAIKPRPFALGGELVVQKTLFLTLSLDHRVVDGAEGARFLGYLAERVEEPWSSSGNVVETTP